MSLNKQQLEAVNQANFPDNNSKFITPELLREFNTDMIDAIQLTGSYATTGSNNFVGNQTITGNLNVSGIISASVLHVQYETASVIFSTGSNQLGDELTDIQTLSGSVKIQGQLLINGVPLTSGSQVDTGSLVTTSSFNQYTQSTNLRLNSLENNSASVNVSITNLNSTTASLNTSITNLNSFSASQKTLNGTFATTGSNTFTGNQIIDRASKLYTNGVYWTDMTAGFNNLEIINQGGGNLDFASLNGGRMRVVNTPLQLTGSILSSNSDISTSANIYAANLTGSGVTINTGSFATTGSNIFYGDQIISGSGTYGIDVTNGIRGDYFYTDTQGVFTPTLYGATAGYGKLQIEALDGVNINGNLTASLQQGYVWVGDSLNKSILVSTASFFVSGSGPTDISSLNAFTASQLNINTGYNTATQSLFTSASLAIVTASVNNDDITFTKGDGTQFTIQVATGSFAISASYAETASYAQFATDIYLNVKNTTGAQLNKGTVVRIIGATGDNALIATASWTNDANSANTLGFLYENIANDSFGKVITQGTLLGINTDPVLGYTAGQILYLSSSGQYTNVKPDAPYHEVRLGQVLRAQQNNGSMYVLIQNGYELEELHDVDINTGSLANNNLLAYNSATLQWENKTLTEVGAASTASFNQYTSSTNSRLTNIETTTASLLIETQNLELFSASALVSISNLNQSSASQQISINALNAATQSYVTETESGSFLITASFDNGTRNLTFTKGNNTQFAVNIPDVSGSGTINTGSFATTGSNAFFGTNTFSGAVSFTGSAPSILSQSFSGSLITNLTDIYTDIPEVQQIVTLTSASYAALLSGSLTNPNTLYIVSGSTTGGGTTDITELNQFTASQLDINSGYNTYTSSTNSRLSNIETITASLLIETANLELFSASQLLLNGTFATTGSNTFTGNQIISRSAAIASLTLQGSETALDLTGSNSYIRQTGVLWFRNQSGSLGFRETNFVTRDNVIQFGADNGFYFGRTDGVDGVNTTGGGVEVNTISGSLVLAPTGQSVLPSALLHLSSSSNTQNVNLIFKNNSFTADTIISGSGNIFTNASAPTAGFKRYMSANNMFSTTFLPQISGSMAWSPNISNNIIGSAGNTITFRGPVSASASNIASNIMGGAVINLGNSAANNFEKATAGVGLQNNGMFGGTLNLIANTTTLQNPPVLNNNGIFGGGPTINYISSSINYNGNLSNSGFTINNRYSPASGSVAGLLSARNISNALLGANHTINIDGTNVSTTTQTKQFSYNIVGGTFITASIPDGDSSAILATTILGNGLIVTGSTLPSSAQAADTANSGQGSMFVGRFNSLTGNTSKTAETIFAVGTGTGYANRKTGFLIDSGSNTFVEGTLNVSGTLFLNGVSISGSGGASTFPYTGNAVISGSLLVSGSTTLQGNTLFTDRSGTPNNNVYLGSNALLSNTTGNNNVAIGQNALQNNTTGNNNFALGANSLQSIVGSNLNVAIGNESGQNASGSSNIFIGGQSGKFITGSANTIIGSYGGSVGTSIDNNIILADGVGNVRAQYSGSAWSFQNDIKFNKGSNKTTDIVTVNGSATINNSLVTADSIIIVTCQDRQNQADEYPPVVGNKTTGAFDIFTNVSTNMQVAYLIINPT